MRGGVATITMFVCRDVLKYLKQSSRKEDPSSRNKDISSRDNEKGILLSRRWRVALERMTFSTVMRPYLSKDLLDSQP